MNSPVCRVFSADGAAQESNLPSRGLHDRTGFDGLREKLHPLGSARLSGAQSCSVGSGRLRWAELRAEGRGASYFHNPCTKGHRLPTKCPSSRAAMSGRARGEPLRSRVTARATTFAPCRPRAPPRAHQQAASKVPEIATLVVELRDGADRGRDAGQQTRSKHLKSAWLNLRTPCAAAVRGRRPVRRTRTGPRGLVTTRNGTAARQAPFPLIGAFRLSARAISSTVSSSVGRSVV
jgi:hypothetical protein